MLKEERYLAYLMIRNSSSLHETLQMDSMKQFSQGDDKFPITRAQEALERLNRWSKATPSGRGVGVVQREQLLHRRVGSRVRVKRPKLRVARPRMISRKSLTRNCSRIVHVSSVERKVTQQRHAPKILMIPRALPVNQSLASN